MHFQMCSPRFKGAMPPLEKPIFSHNICSILDKEHPFQKCNMFETVSTIEEPSCASYHTEQHNIIPYGKKSSCEEAAFLENWTCI